MENTVNQRIGIVIESSGLTINSYAKKIGIAQTSLRDCVKNGAEPKYTTLNKITIAEPHVSLEWLITGKGSMIKEQTSSISINHQMKGAPYYNVDFIGGFDIMLNDQTVNPDYYIDFEPYNKPGVVWCNITGHSMEPAITHGDIIAMQEVKTWNEFLLLDEVYGLVTDEFRTVKRVSQSEKEGCYKLVPVNRSYNSQDIPISIIRKVFKVLGSVKRF